MSDLLNAMTSACRDLGIVPPVTLPAAGKWIKADIEGDPHGKGDARIKLFLVGEGGTACNWKSGEKQTFFAGNYDALTPEQKAARHQANEAARLQADAELKQEQEAAAIKAAAIWKAAKPAPADHPYLKRKGIKASGARLHNDALVIPLLSGGEIQSLQSVTPDGDKLFRPGGRTKGCYFSIGIPKDAAALCIAEGFATGASIHEATGHPVAVAFYAGNLEAVAATMREKFPALPLILCADDDKHGKGQEAATRAALSVGGLFALPDFGTDRPDGAKDFNDMAALCGLEAVKRAIEAAREPDKVTPQPSKKASPASDYASTVELLLASDITPEAVEWLWNGWIAAGKLHILGGAPGTGKTTIAMALAATLTKGGRWPDGTRSPVGNVAIWSGEDDIKNVLVPRLSLSGADLSRVRFVADVFEGADKRPFDPSTDMDTLRRKLAEAGDVRLLIVDSIVSAVTGEGNSNPQVRKSLQPFVDLGNDLGIAVLGITHFRKSSQGSDPVERINGSIAYAALARVVMVAAKKREPEADGRTVRIFLRAKSNYGPDDGGYEYDLHQGAMSEHPDVLASYALWGNPVEGAARELLATAETTADEEGGESIASVSDWLRDLLREEGGKLDRRDVMKASNAVGYKERTVHRAREKLGVIVVQHGFGKDKRSVWTWPNPATPVSIVPILPIKNSGTNGTHGAVNDLVEVEI